MRRYYIFVIILAVFSIAAVGLELAIGRGPANDQKRVDDLAVLSEGVTSWSVNHRQLPDALDQITFRPIQGRLTDYTYQVVSTTQYKLCATFSTERSAPGRYLSSAPNIYNHHKGYQCFTYNVPELEVVPVKSIYQSTPTPKKTPASSPAVSG